MDLNGYMILITQSGDGELKLLGKSAWSVAVNLGPLSFVWHSLRIMVTQSGHPGSD